MPSTSYFHSFSFLFASKFIAACAALACTNAAFAQGVPESRPVQASGVQAIGNTAKTAVGNEPVSIANAWVRATVPGQKGTGAFMTLTARESTRIVGVTSPAAGVAEVHEMAMEGSIMRMRVLPGLDLPAGKAVELKPGGYHLMLMDLNQTITAGSSVPVTLLLQDAKGVKSQWSIALPASITAPGTAPGKKGAAGGMDHSKH